MPLHSTASDVAGIATSPWWTESQLAAIHPRAVAIVGATPSVRITLAAPEADLLASVWPGVGVIYCPRVESASQVQALDEMVSRLERLRGIRPGTIELRPLIESPEGVTMANEIASSSRRIRVLGLGPATELQMAGEALDYARSECALHARAHGLAAADTGYLLD